MLIFLHEKMRKKMNKLHLYLFMQLYMARVGSGSGTFSAKKLRIRNPDIICLTPAVLVTELPVHGADPGGHEDLGGRPLHRSRRLQRISDLRSNNTCCRYAALHPL